MLIPMTKDSQWISTDQKVSGMAYFSGTGPFDAVCSKCTFYVNDGSANERRCAKYRDMVKEWGAKEASAGLQVFRSGSAETEEVMRAYAPFGDDQ